MRNISIRKYLLNKYAFLYIVSVGLVAVSFLLGLIISSVHVPISTVIHIILEKSLQLGIGETIAANEVRIIWNIRLPRVLLAFCVGAALALAGAAFQGLLRNPLADPYTIGVSSGASLGAVIVMFFQLTIIGLGNFTLPIIAIISGLLTLLLVFGLVQLSSRSLAVETIILAGIIVSSFIGAIVSLIISLSDHDAMTQIIYWLYGSVGMRGWNYVQLILPFLFIGMFILISNYRELNAFALGEEAADHIGVDVKKGKRRILIGASLLTGAAVAVSGAIGFVGLVIPHLVRLMTGPNHRHLLLLSVLIGGSFLVLADLVSRTIIAPKELPIGVITALIGAPVFAILLTKEKLRRRR